MYTEKMNKQTQQISDYEYEISLLRKQLEALETEREKDKKKIEELEELLAKAREANTTIMLLKQVSLERSSLIVKLSGSPQTRKLYSGGV